jgi:hypothetical protein
MSSKVPAHELPVMKGYCKTCPFKPDENGRQQNPTLASEVQSRNLFKSHQICHGTEGKNRKANNRCKGSFDTNMEIYERMGYAHLVK